MKKIIVSCIAAVLIFALSIGIYFTATTMSGGEMMEYCIKNSAIDAKKFDGAGISALNLYFPSCYHRLFFSSDQSIPNRQELFIFQNIPLFGLDINRYRLEKAHTETQDGMIGTAIFEPRTATGKKTGQTVLLLYSSNPEKIVHYELSLQDNGKEITVKGGVARDQAFVTGVPLGFQGVVSTVFISGRFYDENYRLVEEISNINSTYN